MAEARRKRMSPGCAHALALLALGVYTLAFQGARGLWEPDEGRYAAVALEMLRGNDWLHPALHQGVPHWTKPPLSYWALASSIRLLGKTTFAVRLPNALAFAATVVLAFCLGRIFVPRSPWLPAVVFATFALPSLASNVVTADTLLALFQAAAMTGFARACWSSGGVWSRRSAAWLGWCALGLALLTKGAAALVPLGALIVFHLSRRSGKPALDLAGWLGSILCLVVGGSWFVAVSAEQPHLATYFVWDEFVLRVMSGYHRRNPHWYGAIVVYAPVALLGTLPWTVPLGRAIVDPMRRWWRGRSGSRDPLDPRDEFLLLWLLLPVALFVIARSRMPLYLLPSFVPAALVVARRLEPAVLLHRRRLSLLAAWAVVLVAARAAGGLVPANRDARAFADRLQAVAPSPRAVVFVGTAPYLGVSLYLDAPVEFVWLDEPGPRRGGWQTLAEALKEPASGRLWIVPVAEADRFAGRVREQGSDARSLGEVRGWQAYRVFALGRPAPAGPAGARRGVVPLR